MGTRMGTRRTTATGYESMTGEKIKLSQGCPAPRHREPGRIIGPAAPKPRETRGLLPPSARDPFLVNVVWVTRFCRGRYVYEFVTDPHSQVTLDGQVLAVLPTGPFAPAVPFRASPGPTDVLGHFRAVALIRNPAAA